jgi:hypothetical protein
MPEQQTAMSSTHEISNPASARIDGLRDAHRQFIIAPENRDLFVRTGRQVIAACNMQMRVERWLEVYEAMLGIVIDFAQEHVEHVAECYAIPRNAKTVLSFVPKSEAFDFELADQLAELQADFQQRFCNILGAIEIGQVPSWDLRRFLDRDTALRVYPTE